MTLIIIIASLILEKFYGHYQHLRKLDWFEGYRDRVLNLAPESLQTGLAGVAIVLLPLVLGLLIIQSLLSGWLFGLLGLVLGVVVLTYCLGPESLYECVEDYLNARESGKQDQASVMAEKITGEALPDDLREQSSQIARSIIVEANSRIFAVIFWFLLLGPVGAFLYRIAVYFMQSSAKAAQKEIQELLPAIELVYGVLDWIPARLVALTYALAGSFDDAMRGWRKSYQGVEDGNFINGNFKVLEITGCGAMRHEVDDINAIKEDHSLDDLQWIYSARTLVIRTIVIWLVIIAVMTLFDVFK